MSVENITIEKSVQAFPIEQVRADFPILRQKMQNKPLVYLDNSNTTQKPQTVIDALMNYYQHSNANIHRSVYTLSEQATALYEGARDRIQKFIGAEQRQEIILVRGTTEGINLIASCFSEMHMKEGDEIIVTAMEHHSNIVPWQFACERFGATLKVVPISDQGELDLQAYADLLTTRTRLLAITQVSNVLGTINPLKKIIRMAHEHHVPVLVDGAQAVPHMPVNVQDLDCDFYIFSGHKMYAPTGVGVLYGKSFWLEGLPPYQGGGSMIQQVSFEGTTYADLPYKFEAGTANIADVIGLGAAVDYLNRLGMSAVAEYEQQLLHYANERLAEIPGLHIIGTAKDKAAVISFLLDDIHPHDVGSILNACGVAVRVGHHCAMPLMERYAVPALVRVSFGIYNTLADIDALIDGLWQVKRMFQ